MMKSDWFGLRAFCVLAALLVALPMSEAQAEEPLPPEITKAVGDWSFCRTDRLRDLIPSERSAEDIVDDALDHCASFEEETARLWEINYGKGSAGQVRELRQRWRASLIEKVNAARGATSVSDPYAIFGDCVGRGIRANKSESASPEEIVAAAISGCHDEGEKLRNYFVEKDGLKKGEESYYYLVGTVKKTLTSKIEEGRE